MGGLNQKFESHIEDHLPPKRTTLIIVHTTPSPSRKPKTKPMLEPENKPRVNKSSITHAAGCDCKILVIDS